jgi:multicomponent Na+:H+ antiporter subunit G
VTALFVWLLLGSGVLLVAASCGGALLMRSAYDRLHFAGAAATIGATPVILAIVVNNGLSLVSLKAGLLWVLLACIAPVLTHATARGLYALERQGRDPSAPP